MATTQEPQTPALVLTALVFGASGVTGHALLKALLAHESHAVFSRVIGLTNRPLASEIAFLPSDERLELYSDIDLLNREESLLKLQHVPNIQQVTHVYYAAYSGHGSGFEELKRVNVEMLTNAVGGVEICCPGLRFITLNTGGKVGD
jgi:nucleoside-diphosphate-sugar epimerase